MSPSKALSFFCVSLVTGIFIDSIIKIPQIFFWVFLLFGFLLMFVFFSVKKDILFIAGFCLMFLVVGALRLQISEFNIENDEFKKMNGKGEVIIEGFIYREPDIRENSQKIKVKVSNSIILITTSLYPEYKYLDKIRIAGNLEEPMEDEEFSYKNYLMKDHIYSVMGFPDIKIIGVVKPTLWQRTYSSILWFKQKLRDSIRANFSPPQSVILEGTVLGDSGVMSKELKEKLNITGLRHIISVSGTHVVILSSIIMSLLLAMGFWRSQAFYIAIIFIILYITLTGLPASGIRAGIMGGLYLFAQKIGRQSVGARVVILACAVMLMFNPLLLFYDVGFQLSFLAVLGLIYLEPIIKFFIKKIIKIKANLAENLISIVSTTFAAQIFTLPIMVYNFGNISFVSPLTNLLVLPVVYWLMVFGFLVSFVGIFSNTLALILSIPCWMLLTYFVKIIDLFSKSWAIKTVQNIHWVWLALLYLVIIFATRFLNRKFSNIY